MKNSKIVYLVGTFQIFGALSSVSAQAATYEGSYEPAASVLVSPNVALTVDQANGVRWKAAEDAYGKCTRAGNKRCELVVSKFNSVNVPKAVPGVRPGAPPQQEFSTSASALMSGFDPQKLQGKEVSFSVEQDSPSKLAAIDIYGLKWKAWEGAYFACRQTFSVCVLDSVTQTMNTPVAGHTTLYSSAVAHLIGYNPISP